MKNSIYALLGFVAGAVVGVFGTQKYLKEKYKQYADEEIESVKEVFRKHYKPEIKTEIKNEEQNPTTVTLFGKTSLDAFDEKPDLKEYAKILSEKYFDETEKSEPNEKQHVGPRIISQDDFNEDTEHNIKNLNYYADGVLTDDWDEVIEHPEESVGTEFKHHFGDDEEDVVYVRNDDEMIDYKIFKTDVDFYDSDMNDILSPEDE